MFIGPDPLSDRVVRNAVLATDGGPSKALNLVEKLLERRPLDLAPLRFRSSDVWLQPLAAFTGAVPMVPILGTEGPSTALAFSFAFELLLPSSTVSLKSCSAIRTHDLKVFDSVVVPNAVHVIDNQRDDVPAPVFVLTAELSESTSNSRRGLPLVASLARAPSSALRLPRPEDRNGRYRSATPRPSS